VNIGYTTSEMPRPRTLTPDILKAALSGLEAQRQRIDGQINEVRRLLGSNPRTATQTAAPEAPSRPKRTMSAAARSRIAAAQRKRWAETKATSAPAAPGKAVRKRKLSAAGRKAIAEAAKRRWAALRAAREASE
jgi:hypothetical protein